jgi:hypothetical protein
MHNTIPRMGAGVIRKSRLVQGGWLRLLFSSLMEVELIYKKYSLLHFLICTYKNACIGVKQHSPNKIKNKYTTAPNFPVPFCHPSLPLLPALTQSSGNY